METYNTKDALGNEIVMGNKYGYSQSSNGHTRISIGIAQNFSKTGLLTLKVDERRSSLYNNGFGETDTTPTKITCKPAMVFPIIEPLKKVIVVTNPELGWDCVMGVYTSKDAVIADDIDPNDKQLVFSEQTLDNLF